MGRIFGIIPPPSDIQRVLDPVIEQARAIARLNDRAACTLLLVAPRAA